MLAAHKRKDKTLVPFRSGSAFQELQVVYQSKSILKMWHIVARQIDALFLILETAVEHGFCGKSAPIYRV